MVVSERWKVVSDWVERAQPSMRVHFPEVPQLPGGSSSCTHITNQANIQEGGSGQAIPTVKGFLDSEGDRHNKLDPIGFGTLENLDSERERVPQHSDF